MTDTIDKTKMHLEYVQFRQPERGDDCKITLSIPKEYAARFIALFGIPQNGESTYVTIEKYNGE